MEKMQTEDCTPGVKCRLGSLDEIYEHFWILSKKIKLKRNLRLVRAFNLFQFKEDSRLQFFK